MLKKIVMAAIASSCLITGVSAQFLDKKDFPAVPQLSKFNMSLEAVEDNGGDFIKLYALDASNPKQIRNVVAYSTRNGSTMFYGQQIQFLQADGLQAFPQDPSLIAELKKEAIFTVGNGTEEYIVFTDPECPYCQKFDAALPNLKDNIKLYVLFYPLSFHKDAVQMASYVMDAPIEERHKRLSSVSDKNGEWKDYNKPLAVEKIKKQMILGMRLGVQGTPSIFATNGKMQDISRFMRTKFKQTSVVPADLSVSPKVLTFFKNQDLMIELNPESKKPELIIFAGVEDANSQKLFKSDTKLLSEFKVSVVLFPRETQSSIIKTLDVYASPDEKTKIQKFKNYLAGKDISKARQSEINKELQAKSPEISELIGKVSMLRQAASQLKLDNLPNGVMSNGKFKSIKSFYQN